MIDHYQPTIWIGPFLNHSSTTSKRWWPFVDQYMIFIANKSFTIHYLVFIVTTMINLWLSISHLGHSPVGHSVDHHLPVHDAGGLDGCTLALRVGRDVALHREGAPQGCLEILSSRCWDHLGLRDFEASDLIFLLAKKAKLQKVDYLPLWELYELVGLVYTCIYYVFRFFTVFLGGPCGGADTHAHKGRNSKFAFCDIVHWLFAKYICFGTCSS